MIWEIITRNKNTYTSTLESNISTKQRYTEKRACFITVFGGGWSNYFLIFEIMHFSWSVRFNSRKHFKKNIDFCTFYFTWKIFYVHQSDYSDALNVLLKQFISSSDKTTRTGFLKNTFYIHANCAWQYEWNHKDVLRVSLRNFLHIVVELNKNIQCTELWLLPRKRERESLCVCVCLCVCEMRDEFHNKYAR